MASAFADYDSSGVHRFGFELDHIMCKSIKSIEGLSLKMDKIETRSNNERGLPIHKVYAGNKQFLGSITATRVMTDDPLWHDWYQKALNNVVHARMNGRIFIYSNNPEADKIVREYHFVHAFPIEFKVTGMNAATAAPIEETVVFMYEELTMQNVS